MPVTIAPVTGGMLDFELDDDFWPGALAALLDDDPATRLRERWPAFVELIDGLVADAQREPCLVGFRLATHGRNPRLFAFLTGALLARSGIFTLLLDLSPDTRWLEQLLGGDYKEGFVDYLRFGLPLDSGTRETGLEGFSAMSGGAWFLAGSPLDDAPGFRAGLQELRQRYRAVVVTLPPPLEAGDRTGVSALCDALVTVEERGTDASIAGGERAVVRLKGNADAARDLAHLTHRFLGPLPLLLGRKRPRQASSAGPRATGLDDVAFLRGFETSSSHPGAAPHPALAAATERGPDSRSAPHKRTGSRPPGAWEEGRSASPPQRRVGRRPRRFAVATLVALSLLVLAAISSRGIALDAVRELLGEPDRSTREVGGQTIALDPLPGSVPEPLPDSATDGETVDLAAAGGGQPAPFTVHVGSYQSAASAMRVVEQVEEMGYVATLAPVALPARGRWYRVYAGSFADSTDASRARDHLQASAVIDEGVVRSAPWTFEVGTYASPEAARADISLLRENGIAVYAVGHAPVRLYAGAYRSREEAALLAETLESVLDSRDVRLIAREE